MSVDTLKPILAEHPLLRGLGDDDLALLSGCASNVRFEPDQTIFRQGESADHCYLIRHGRVAVQIFSPHHGLLTVQTLAPGEVVGWSWLFPPYQWHFDARARASTFRTASPRERTASIVIFTTERRPGIDRCSPIARQN